MPPRQKINEQMILEAGYELARRNGIEHVNARNISVLLSCSTQPVFSCFPTMMDLRKGIFDFACKKFVADGIAFVNSDNRTDFLELSIQWYLITLRQEPYLYRLLYFSDAYGQGAPNDFILRYTSGSMVLAKMKALYRIGEAACKDILIRSYGLLHGIGALVFYNNFEISDGEIADMVKRSVSDMVLTAQNES